MGVVYKARDPLIDRLVALKTITTGLAEDPSQLARFNQEAHSAGALQHPNIVTIYELGEAEDTPFIAMEYLSGQSLDKLIKGRHKLPLSQKVGYIAYVCRALAYAHKQGVVHRDIKPANVMVTSEGTVKVVDFGIARIAESSRSQTGQVIGTFAYMSPQQIDGGRADARSDVWAAGVVFYELLAYRRPFDGESYGAVMQSVMRKNVPPLSETAPGTPSDVADLVDLMLRKDIDERFQSMKEVLIDLEPVWRRLQNAEVADLLAASRETFKSGDVGKAYEMVRRVLQIDTANRAAKDLLEQLNAEMWRNRTVPPPPVEGDPQGDETLVGPAIGAYRPSHVAAPPLTPPRAQKGPVTSGQAAESVNRLRAPDARRPVAVRSEVPSAAPTAAAVTRWKRPVPIALLALAAIVAGGGTYLLRARRPGTPTSATPVASAAPVSGELPLTPAPVSSNHSQRDPASVLPPVSKPASGITASTEGEKRVVPVTGDSVKATGPVQGPVNQRQDSNTPTRANPAPEPQAPSGQGGAGRGAGQGATPPALDRTEVVVSNPVPPPAAERSSQPAAISPQPVVPPSQLVAAAAPPAAIVAEPAPPSKAVEPPVVSSAPPDNVDRQAIAVSLQQLSTAFSHRSLAELGELWPKLPKDDKSTYKRAFDAAKSIRREFHLQSLNISNDGAFATAIGTYEGAVQDGRGVETPNSGNFYVRFAKKNGRWYIDEARF